MVGVFILDELDKLRLWDVRPNCILDRRLVKDFVNINSDIIWQICTYANLHVWGIPKYIVGAE